MMSQNVLIVGQALTGGGAERRFANIAAHLFGGGVDVAVLAGGTASVAGISGEVLSLGYSGRLSYFRAAWLLSKRIKMRRYDVVMAFGLFPNVLVVCASAISRSQTKVIVSEITRPKMEVMNAATWRRIAYTMMRSWFYRRSDLITANSIDGLREACELAGVGFERGVRISNVIDSADIGRRAAAGTSGAIPAPSERYVICVSRLDVMKRLDTVVRAIASLTSLLECQLMIVGNGAARRQLEALVDMLDVRSKVKFAGSLENPIGLLSGATAFVLASEYEGFSNSVLEAMFVDVPVITSRCSTDAEEMCAAGAALGFDVGNVKQLANHIETIFKNPEVRRALVAQARNYRKPHEIENAIPLYEQMIRQVAGVRSHSSTVDAPCAADDVKQ